MRISSNENHRIAVLGSSGLLGSRLIAHLRSKEAHVTGSHEETSVNRKVNVTDYDSLSLFLNIFNPNIIINLVAQTNVDMCENNRELAYQLNVGSVDNIVKWIKQYSPLCRLIHISTDHVYDGNGLKKEEQINLINYYAHTKFISENVASCINATIFRTNFFGKSRSEGRKSITDWIFNALEKREEIKIFNDIFFNPVSIKTLLDVIEDACVNEYRGVYNVGSHDGLSKADFVENFSRFLGKDTSILNRVSYISNHSLNTKRPKNMMMNVDKYEKVSMRRMKTLMEEIKIACGEYEDGL